MRPQIRAGANAENHAKYLYKQATEGTFRTASWHFTVDDKQIYQHLPTNENGWHAGDGDGSGNRSLSVSRLRLTKTVITIKR